MAIKKTPYNVAQSKRIPGAIPQPMGLEVPEDFSGDEALQGANMAIAQAALAQPGLSASYQTGKSAPSMEEFNREIKPYLDYTGFNPETIDSYRDARTAELDKVREALLQHSKPSFDLRPLAGLAEAYSGQPTLKYVSEPTQTADSIINRDQALAKMIQDQREGGVKEKSNLLERITSMFPSGVRVDIRHSQPSTGGTLNPNSQAKLLAELSNKLQPDAATSFLVKMQELQKSFGDFDPKNQNSIQGIGNLGLGFLQRNIPMLPGHDEAAKNWANLQDAASIARHQLFAGNLTANEERLFDAIAGVGAQTPPDVVRGYAAKLVEAWANRVDSVKAGYPSVRSYYDTQPGAIMSDQFRNMLPRPKVQPKDPFEKWITK